ncbi:MAG TPA: hypothetical protein VKB79_08325 [Bryobacteraceae bacterium]|nr:hypothetical protein [Bryobacteraceae bacterium]
MAVLAAVTPADGRAYDGSAGARTIVSITICNQDETGALTAACDGAYDTERPVLAPGASDINTFGVSTASDGHSTVFPPGRLDGNPDYRLFVASGFKGVNADIGVMVLSSLGPDEHGQWTAQPATAEGYGSYAIGPGAVFMPPMKPTQCPALTGPAGTPLPLSQQDATFDLNYAAAGSIFAIPGGPSSRLLMVYEGNNDCIGAPGGPKLGVKNSYQSTGIATSLDGGRTWPRYAPKEPYIPALLPFANPSVDDHGPRAPLGAMGQDVCSGNVCPASLPPSANPSNYGRYEVLAPRQSLNDLMMQATPINGQYGHAEPSAFVDDVHPNDDENGPSPYVYVLTHYLSNGMTPLQPPSNGRKDDLSIARARMDRDGTPLHFSKWTGSAFSAISDGLSDTDAPMLPAASDGNFTACGDNLDNQGRSMGSISWVEETRQYLLVFVCTSPGDPAGGSPSTRFGSAWFYSTNDDLNNQNAWTVPKEIEGSYQDHDTSAGAGCPVYHGWYPSFMSLNEEPGHLSTQGFVFYMKGSQGACTGGGLPPRVYSSRQFTIATAPR